MSNTDTLITTNIASLLRMIINLRVEVDSLLLVLRAQGGAPLQAFELACAETRKGYQSAIDQLEGASAQKTFELLRSFEGTVQ